MLKLNKMGALALAITGLGAVQAATVNATIAGWNLLGYSDATDVVVADAFGDKTKVTTVWKWTGAGWAFYSPDLPDGGQAYAFSKGYDFLTMIKSGDGFWVNAKQTFSATLPAPAAPVNTAALAGITATMTAFQNLFATAIPTTTTNLAPLVDDTFLMNGINKATFLDAMLQPGNGPSVGGTFVNIALVNSLDAGSVPNDATHQWFTFSESTGGGSDSAWLAIKNAAGNWLVAGDRRVLDFWTHTQVVKHIPLVSAVTYNNQINAGMDVGQLPADTSQVVLTGAGVIPASGITIYSVGVGQMFAQTCGVYNTTTNCIDAGAAVAGSQYTIKVYTTASASVPAYTYTNALKTAPMAASNWASAPFATITGVTGTWSPGSSVNVNWTLPATTRADWVNVNAWQNGGSQLFNNVGTNLSAGDTAATLTLPNYSGTIAGKGVWLTTIDANGNRLAVDKQL